jgi:uncharacterized protein (DUF58 family)
VLGYALLVLGILFQRLDLALLGMPLLLAILMVPSLAPRRITSGEFQAAQPAKSSSITAGNTGYPLTIASTPGADTTQIRAFAPGHRPTTLVTNRSEIELFHDSKRTGPQPTFTVQGRSYSAFDVLVEEPWVAQGKDLLGLPTASPLSQLPAPNRLRGLTGARNSRRIGDGGELRDIATMRPGDSLRRVDWRATGRRSPELEQLYVRRTFSHAEGIAELVIDSRDDVGPDLETWRGSGPQRVDEHTSLDYARHAALSVATGLLAAGDRVGMEDLAFQRRPVAASSGQRQLRRIQQALASAAPHGEPTEVVRPPRLPADAVIYLFSTLLDDTPLTLVDGWIDQGNPVIVIDTLPQVKAGRNASLALAWRIITLEREYRVRVLASRGVPIIPWRQADSTIPAGELAKVARTQARARGRR